MAENDSNPLPAAVATESITESPSESKDLPSQSPSQNDVKADEEEEKDVVAAEESHNEKVKAEDVSVVEETETEKEKEKEKGEAEEEVKIIGEEKEQTKEESESLKEESNRVSDTERKGVQELNKLLREELEGDVSIWGVPLFKDERTDVILLKFLRARELKVKDALLMIHNTLRWRKEFNIDALVDEEDLGDDFDKVVFMHGHGREGHPVCYNVYGEFQNKDLYHKAFSTHDNRTKFLRWRIQLLEHSIRKLDFTPSGINTIFQVNDLKNSPGPAKRELRLATKQALQLLQDNYPEFVAKQVFINVPWWYLAFYTMINPFLTQRTKSKFVFAGPSKSPDTLFKYISPEQVPIQYGGLSVDFCDCNPDFSMSDPVTEIPIKPNTKQTVEIAIYEKCIIVWELRVVGWEVSYNAEFKPDAKDAYTVIIQKTTKMSPTDEPVLSNTFKVSDLGKLLLTVDNPTLKKKRLLYRFKIKPYSD